MGLSSHAQGLLLLHLRWPLLMPFALYSSLMQFKLEFAPVIRNSFLLTDFLKLKQTKENLQLFCLAGFLKAYMTVNLC
jgi:hypothetical protein